MNNIRCFVRLFRTNIRMFGIFVIAIIYTIIRQKYLNTIKFAHIICDIFCRNHQLGSKMVIETY